MSQGPHPGKVNGPRGTRASGPSRGSDERLLGSYCAGCGGLGDGGCGCGCMVLVLVVSGGSCDCAYWGYRGRGCCCCLSLFCSTGVVSEI